MVIETELRLDGEKRKTKTQKNTQHTWSYADVLHTHVVLVVAVMVNIIYTSVSTSSTSITSVIVAEPNGQQLT